MQIFTQLADFITYRLLSLNAATKIADSVHFFIEDITKIFTLLIILIYVISLLRAGIDPERIRKFLSGKNRGISYLLASLFGAVTPFCSCSSIPLFIGFTQASIPVGITISFLVTSPIINEVALVMLGSLLGWKFMVLYAVVGILSGILGGLFFDLIKADRYLTPFAKRGASLPIEKKTSTDDNETEASHRSSLSMKERHQFAKTELLTILGRVWKWVLIGVGIGALFHGYIPTEFITTHLGAGKFWTVPSAVLIGIPLYSNASGVIPIAETLLQKGLPVGTTLAFMLSTVAASLPEFMMLKQVMKTRLLVIFFLLLLVLFTITGFIFNAVNFV